MVNAPLTISRRDGLTQRVFRITHVISYMRNPESVMAAHASLPFALAWRGKRLSPTKTAVVGLSLAAHAGVAAYLAMMQFAPPAIPPIDEPPPIDGRIFENIELVPPTPDEAPPKVVAPRPSPLPRSCR